MSLISSLLACYQLISMLLRWWKISAFEVIFISFRGDLLWALKKRYRMYQYLFWSRKDKAVGETIILLDRAICSRGK